MTRAYRLHGLERLRERALADRKHELAEALSARLSVEHQVEHLQDAELAARQALVDEIAEPVVMGVWAELADTHRRGRARAQARLEQARHAEAMARDAVAAARQQLRVLERLRERLAEEARLEEARAEERELNDRNAGRFVRRAAGEGR